MLRSAWEPSWCTWSQEWVCFHAAAQIYVKEMETASICVNPLEIIS